MSNEAIAMAAAEILPPKEVKISENLSCELNEVEWQNRARELADAQEHLEREEQRKKDVTKQLNSDVSGAKSQVSKLASVVATRREQRDVTVIVRYNYELGTVSKIRTDNDQVISEREMTDQERQTELELVDANDVIEGARAEERADEDIMKDATEPDAPAIENRKLSGNATTSVEVPADEDDDDIEDVTEGDLEPDQEDDEDWGDEEGNDGDDTPAR